MKKIFQLTIVFLFVLFCEDSFAQKKIEWLSFEEAILRANTAPKKIFIDLYTDWCGWCKRLDATTFMDSAIVEKMSSGFYAVKLNAERRDTIVFPNRTFIFRPELKTHELALALMDNKIEGYPAFVILESDMSVLTRNTGYMTAEMLAPMLEYFRGGFYKAQSYEEFSKAAVAK